jgi:hypothetical protein
MPLFLWYSKRQGTVETAIFGAESIATKVRTGVTRSMRYMFRMMGIVPIDGTRIYVYGDNMSVTHKTQRLWSSTFEQEEQCYLLPSHE